MKSKLSFYIVSFSLGVFLLLWGYENLFPVEKMENRLVEEYMSNWYTAPIIARLFIALNFAVGLFFILNINPGNILPKIFLGIMCLSLYDLAWEALTTNHIISPGYSRFFGTELYLSMVICTALIVAAIALMKFGAPTDMKYKWLKYPIGISLFSLPFILNPVYPSDLMDQSIPVERTFELEAFVGLPEKHLTSKKTLLTFYSTSCPYCLNAMRRLAISKKQAQEYIPVFIGFLGSEEGISAFFQTARTEFNYAILEAEQFYKLSGSSYPSFVLLENGVATTMWDGRTFNYFTLQELAE